MDATNITRLAEHIRKEVEREVNAPLVLYMARGIFFINAPESLDTISKLSMQNGGRKKMQNH